MTFTPFFILDQFRFVLELLAAEFLFALPFARRRGRFTLRSVIGITGLTLFSLIYFIWPKTQILNAAGLPALPTAASFISWYVLLTVLSGAILELSFTLPAADLLYVMVAGYAAQHIEYALINELTVDWFLPQLEDNLFLYAMLCTVTTFLLYLLLYVLLLQGKAWSGGLFESSTRVCLMFGAMLIVLIAASFTEQILFNYMDASTGVPVLAVLLDVLCCCLILMVMTSVGDTARLYRDRALLEQMLDEREHQYRMSAQTIEIINRKSHDLKHQIAALRHVSSENAAASLREVEESVQIYDSVLKTGNDALDTLLTEKKLLCDGQGIQLTTMVDGAAIAFMDPIDLYTLLGNALDNAIECEQHYPESLRSISLTIAPHGRMLRIELTNYYEGTLQLRDGLPATTKPDRDNHGFGMRSMRAIAERYGGTLECGSEGSAFILQIIMPMA